MTAPEVKKAVAPIGVVLNPELLVGVKGRATY
jgi:hypothetical protein